MTMMTMIIITKMMMIIGSLNNDDVEDNENAEKANKYSLPNLKKIYLHVDNALLYISLVSFHELPNFTFLEKCFYNLTPEKFTNIWQIATWKKSDEFWNSLS